MRLILNFLLICSVSNALSGRTTIGSRSLERLTSPRRSFVATTLAFVANLGLSPNTHSVANALQERNEALCSTGFFTNIWQYKCTVVGDIEDEGVAKELSSDDERTVDSLLSKLSIVDGNNATTIPW